LLLLILPTGSGWGWPRNS